MSPTTEINARATAELEALTATEPHLLDRPQRFGILPTWSFWRDEENARLVKWPVRLAIAAAFIFAIVVDAGWLLAGLLPIVGIAITLGLIERHVRRRALERRMLAQGPERPSIGTTNRYSDHSSRGGAT
jgi:hypothetical protein